MGDVWSMAVCVHTWRPTMPLGHSSCEDRCPKKGAGSGPLCTTPPPGRPGSEEEPISVLPKLWAGGKIIPTFGHIGLSRPCETLFLMSPRTGWIAGAAAGER